jgi:hypothetical protein
LVGGKQERNIMKKTMVVVAAAGLASTAVAFHPPLLNKDDARIARTRPLPTTGGHTDVFPFTDNFDSYPLGGLAGNGGWQLWAAGSVDGQVSNEQSSSASQSYKQIPQIDIVQLGSVTAGIWELKCMTYAPSTNVATGANDGAFVIGLNTWNPANPGGATQDYSMQIQWYKGATGGPVVRDYNQAAAGCPVSTTVPMVQDQWVPFRAVINLTTNTYDAYYNNVQFVTGKSWTKGVLGCSSATNPPVQIQSFDIYNGTTTATGPNDKFYFDDFSFTQQTVPTCYANCDASTNAPCLNVNDFICFNNTYATGNTRANCDLSTLAPILNVNDFICFNNSYASGCANPCAAP